MATTGEGERNCVTFLWRIENIGRRDGDMHVLIMRSPFFSVLEGEESNCFLRLYNPASSKKGKNLIISLRIHEPETITSPMDIEFSFLRCDGSPLLTRELKEQEYDQDGIFIPDPPTREEVFVTRKSEFIPNDTLTVRCRFWKSGGSFERARFISACTRIEVSEDCFLLPMNNLQKGKIESKLKLFDNELICSLDGESLQNCNLTVQFDERYDSFNLTLKVSCVDDDQEVTLLCERKLICFPLDSTGKWNVRNMNLKNLLLKQKPSFGHDKNFTLVFHVTGTFLSRFIERMVIGKSSFEHGKTIGIPVSSEASCRTNEKCCPDTPDNVRSDSMSALVEDFQSLYCKQNFSDFKLRSGDVSFPVLKGVLSARSPVFEAMFTSDMKESGTDSLDIPDLDCHTLNRMLTFLYTGTLEPDLEWESAAKVYYAADKYQVQTLKQECSSILKSAVSVSNVSDMLALAHKHEDEDLTSFVHDFILSRFDEVMHSAEWENFMNTDPALGGISIFQLCKKRKTLI